jgi:hypothetical protein
MNIGELKAILPRKARGANLDDIQGITDFTLFREAASNLLLKLDPMSTQRHATILLYPGVTDYAAWEDLKGKKVIALNPQGKRRNSPTFHQDYAEDIRDGNDANRLGVEFNNGLKAVRIAAALGSGTGIDEVDSTDSWAVSGLASNLEEDDLIFSEGALRFDIGSGSNLLTWNGDAVDLSEFENQGAIFRDFYLPDESVIASITLRIGESAAKYWSIPGEAVLGDLVDGINAVKFDWDGIAGTGSPDPSLIAYQRVEIVATAADTDLRMAKAVASLPKPYEGVYYSNRLFRGTDGEWKATPDDDDDEIMLELEEENAFVYEVCELIASDMQRTDRSGKFDAKLNGDANEPGIYSKVRTEKPSEAKRPSNRFYRPLRFHDRGTRIRGGGPSW